MINRICSSHKKGHFNFRNVEYLTFSRNYRADLILQLRSSLQGSVGFRIRCHTQSLEDTFLHSFSLLPWKFAKPIIQRQCIHVFDSSWLYSNLVQIIIFKHASGIQYRHLSLSRRLPIVKNGYSSFVLILRGGRSQCSFAVDRCNRCWCRCFLCL